MQPRIGVMTIAGVGLVTAAVIGGMSALILKAHQAALVAQLTRSADRLSETIGRSTYFDMLENRRDAMHREILTIGAQPGIDKVRLFNATGTIVFSSDEAEIGRSVDRRAEACTACHAADQPLHRLSMRERTRIYPAADHRVLGVIRPIRNEAACANGACHAHARTDVVLGVLDVNLSLRDVDLQIASDRRRLILLAILAIAASSALLWWLNDRLVLRPVAALRAATRRVAEGDLTSTVPAGARHELGDLARAFNDMTRRLGEAQRQLAQADKLASVGRLAAGVAHEINNPLTGVLTYASLLLKRPGMEPEARQDLEVIVRETKRCREIVRGLLDFARPSPPRRQPTDLNEVVRRGVAVVMNQLALSHVSLDLDLADDLAPVPADGNQMQQVIVNLLINAADAIGESGGTIGVATRQVTRPARGFEVVRAALCPRGCDLLDPAVRIGGHAAIRVLRRIGGVDALVHLDPVYGRGHHRDPGSCPRGVVATVLCPACHTRLETAGRSCGDCGAPAFALDTGATGRIEWCSRTGCGWTRWDAIDARPPRAYAELTLTDSGHGIPPEHLGHLFEPFFTTKGTRGSGLGLAVSWGIVEAHGGSIEVESPDDGGTRFTVRLPAAGSPDDAARGASASGGGEPERGAA